MAFILINSTFPKVDPIKEPLITWRKNLLNPKEVALAVKILKIETPSIPPIKKGEGILSILAIKPDNSDINIVIKKYNIISYNNFQSCSLNN